VDLLLVQLLMVVLQMLKIAPVEHQFVLHSLVDYVGNLLICVLIDLLVPIPMQQQLIQVIVHVVTNIVLLPLGVYVMQRQTLV